jgi:hypothetical protein
MGCAGGLCPVSDHYTVQGACFDRLDGFVSEIDGVNRPRLLVCR